MKVRTTLQLAEVCFVTETCTPDDGRLGRIAMNSSHLSSASSALLNEQSANSAKQEIVLPFKNWIFSIPEGISSKTRKSLGNRGTFGL
jgi:hypothetical protein